MSGYGRHHGGGGYGGGGYGGHGGGHHGGHRDGGRRGGHGHHEDDAGAEYLASIFGTEKDKWVILNQIYQIMVRWLNFRF